MESEESGTSASAVARPSPSVNEIEKWHVEDVLSYLQKVYPDISKKTVGILQENEVNGRAFLELTEEKLRQDGMVRGPAIVIAKEVQELRAESFSLKSNAPFVYPDESADGRDSMMVMSPERLKIFTDYMNSHRVGLVRSPPYSGKTTLGTRLEEYFLSQGVDAVYITLAPLAEAYTVAVFDKYWKSKIGISWTSISNCTTPTKIIIDEAQVLYNTADSFWGTLKALNSGHYNNNLSVLLLSTYHPSYLVVTPMTFPDALGLSSLRLTRDELGQVVNMYVGKRQNERGGRNFNIPKAVEEKIFNFTHGYVGLCRTALFDLHQKFPDGRTSQAMLKHLTSADFLNSITSSRALYWIRDWQPTDNEADFLRNLLLMCDRDSTFPTIDISSYPVLNSYLKIGIIIEDCYNGKMYFSAPIMRIVMSRHLFTAPINMPRVPTNIFDEFLLRTIERICPSTLRESFGRGIDARLLERTWQMEWYRTARITAPVNSTVSPDVGHIFGSDGYLDFYVDGDFGWGIELLRDGEKMKEHAERFEQDGEYESIPVNQYAIIDFRHCSKRVQNVKPHFWHVLCSNDYEHVTIIRYNEEERFIRLIGDDFKRM